jgi:hypothetical protein
MEKNIKVEGKRYITLELNDDMNIKIQTLDNIYPIVVKRQITVQELKEKIEQVMISANIVL